MKTNGTGRGTVAPDARRASLLALLLALTCGGSVARAEGTLQERVAALEERVDAHRRDKAVGDLAEDLEQTLILFKEAERTQDGDRVQARLVKMVGSLTKVRDDVVRIPALDALGSMGHEDGATYLKPFLKATLDERAQKRSAAAIDAAGEVADDALVLPLLKIVDKSKSYALAAKAAQALGRFRSSKRFRERIVEELAGTLKRDMPGRPKPGRDTPDAYIPGKNGTAGTARWAALAGVLPGALNQLTGQRIGSIGEWLTIIHEYRRDLGVLFVDTDDEDESS